MEIIINGIRQSNSTSTTNNEMSSNISSTRDVTRTGNIYRTGNGTSTLIIKSNMTMVLMINVDTNLSDQVTTHRTCNGMGVAAS